MAFCPICSDLLLRHIHAGHSYLYCQHCRIELPEALETQKIELGQSQTEMFPTEVMPRNMKSSIEASAK